MGILDIVTGHAHMSRLSNGGNQTKGGWNGLEVKKKVKCSGTWVRSNFLVGKVHLFNDTKIKRSKNSYLNFV
jgi:hypothetical protein